MEENSRWLSTKEIRQKYPIGKSRLYMCLETGALRSVRWGRKYLVRTQDLEDFLWNNRDTLEELYQQNERPLELDNK